MKLTVKTVERRRTQTYLTFKEKELDGRGVMFTNQLLRTKGLSKLKKGDQLHVRVYRKRTGVDTIKLIELL